nr:transglycosylase SLT domain-containing protein [Roseomonas acroporae]
MPAVPVPPATPFAARRARYVAEVHRLAEQRGLPPALADAVAVVESAYDPEATGLDGEVGIMQILPNTAAMLGFRGTPEELREPTTNLRFAVAYLARAWQLAEGDVCRALMKYRAGHGEEWMSPLSVEYCRRAVGYLAGIGSPLAAGVALPAAAAMPAGVAAPGRVVGTGLTRPELVRLRTGQRTEADSQRYWAAHEARIRALRERLQARRRG